MDVRQPEEYAKGFIDGAVNIAMRELAANLRALPAMDKDIVLVCESGYRSAVGMAVLRMLGYKNVRTLEGGMKAWRAGEALRRSRRRFLRGPQVRRRRSMPGCCRCSTTT